MVKNLHYIAKIIASVLIFASCSISPIWKLTYLDEHRHEYLPRVNGCYYKLDYQSNDSTIINLRFYVFFENGLAKKGNFRYDNNLISEEAIMSMLSADFYNRPYTWRTYIVNKDTLFMQYFLPTSVIVRYVGHEQGIFENDTVLKIVKIQKRDITFNKNDIYRFFPFENLPDSTGYLNEKLQKKRAKRLKKKKK